jgi:hypothetical protein
MDEPTLQYIQWLFGSSQEALAVGLAGQENQENESNIHN